MQMHPGIIHFMISLAECPQLDPVCIPEGRLFFYFSHSLNHEVMNDLSSTNALYEQSLKNSFMAFHGSILKSEIERPRMRNS